MKTTTYPKSKIDRNAFEDLQYDEFDNMKWNPGMIARAIPKSENRIKKMRSR
ncbi:hypothetical protein [Flavobacterium sp.]|uniref:hypothetical protein n=1 Tax=Flavobacterium sp. TaxID=239 RepID=UPI0025BDB6E4|nr:hypothetical protein [Flavobacterium sp.]